MKYGIRIVPKGTLEGGAVGTVLASDTPVVGHLLVQHNPNDTPQDWARNEMAAVFDGIAAAEKYAREERQRYSNPDIPFAGLPERVGASPVVREVDRAGPGSILR